MALRNVSERDENKLAELLADYWKERGMPQYDVAWAKAYLKEGHKKEIARDEFFVFEQEGNMVGVIALITDVSGVAEIRDTVIKPEHRKKGFGKQMLTELVALAKERKLRKLFSLSFPQYERLLTSVGFEKEGVLKNHFAQGEDLVVMSLFLR